MTSSQFDCNLKGIFPRWLEGGTFWGFLSIFFLCSVFERSFTLYSLLILFSEAFNPVVASFIGSGKEWRWNSGSDLITRVSECERNIFTSCDFSSVSMMKQFEIVIFALANPAALIHGWFCNNRTFSILLITYFLIFCRKNLKNPLKFWKS